MSIFSKPTGRRDFIRKSLAIIPAVSIVRSGLVAPETPPATEAASAQPASASAENAVHEGSSPYHPCYFTAEEWTFLGAACSRLIPNDENGPGALELGGPEFIDRQMNGPFGHGSRWYLKGPFFEGPPELGYQSRLTPRDVYRMGIAATDAHCQSTLGSRRFVELSPKQRDEVLKGLEAGTIVFPDSDSKAFFTLLLQNVKEGYLADPVHGGNKAMGSWKMIGFPGARADFLDWVDRPGAHYPLGPVSVVGGRS